MSDGSVQTGEMPEEVAQTTRGVAEYMQQRAELEGGKRASMDLDAILDPGGDSPSAEEAGKGASERSQDGAGDSAPTKRETSGADSKPEQERADGVRGESSATQPESADEGSAGDGPPDEPPPWLAKFERRITRRADRRHKQAMDQKDAEIAALRAQIDGSSASAAADGTRTETAGDDDALDAPYPRKEEYGDDQEAFQADVDRWNNGEQLAGPPNKQQRGTQQNRSEQETGREEGTKPASSETAATDSKIEDLAMDLAEILDERSGNDEDLDQELRELGKARRISLSETMLEHMVDGMEEEAVERAVRAIIKRPLSARKIARLPANRQAAALDKLAEPPDEDGEDRTDRRATNTASRRSLPASNRAADPDKSEMDFPAYLTARRGEDQRAFGGIDTLN